MAQANSETKDTIRELFSDVFYGKKSNYICELVGEKVIFNYIDELIRNCENISEESRPSVAKLITNFLDLNLDSQIRQYLCSDSINRLTQYFIGNLIITGSLSYEKKQEIMYSLDFIASCLEKFEGEYETEMPAKVFLASHFRSLEVLYLLYIIVLQVSSRYINKKAMICINYILYYKSDLKEFLCEPQRADSLIEKFKEILSTN
jgi:hypothetical protein